MNARSRDLLKVGALLLAVASPARWVWDYLTATETWLSLHSATRREETPGGLAQSLSTVGGESRLAIFAHPPSALAWNLPLRRGRHRFRAELSIREEAWDKSDGVGFRAAVVDRGTEAEIGLWRLDPSSGRPRWIPAEGTFSTSGQEVTLILATTAGPDDHSAWDGALWAEPRLRELTAPPHLPAILLGAMTLLVLSRRKLPAPS